jgi:transposase
MFKNYNMIKLILPLDFEVKLQENDIAFSIHHLVESIPDGAFDSFLRYTVCPAHHLCMMLKIILCGNTQSAFSGRKIEGLVEREHSYDVACQRL